MTKLARVAALTAVAVGLAFLPSACGKATALERPELDRLLASYADVTDGAVGVTALVRTPAGTWRGAAGSADLGGRRPLRTGDRFRAGSVTKAFTATVLLQLVAEHKLRLDDTLAQRLPGAFAYGNRITVRQLLDHTSGIRDARDDEFPPMSTVIPHIRDTRLRTQAIDLARRKARGENVVAPWRIWVAAAATQPPLFTPGSRFHYSNINYAVLGQIIERRTGHTLAAELEERIFRPLHLDHTELATTTAIGGSYAHGYITGGSRPVDVTTTADDLRTMLGSGYGAIVTTTDDLARFYSALLDGNLLPATQLEQMLTPTPTPPHWGDIPAIGYGLGQTHYELRCGDAWGHGGGLDGYLTQVITDRRGRHIVVVAANSTGGASSAAKTQLSVALYCRSSRVGRR